jgi:hypothetical protein
MTGLSIDPIIVALDELNQIYYIEYTRDDDEVKFTVSGIEDEFLVYAPEGTKDYCVGPIKVWHEHFDTPGEFKQLMESLFAGSAYEIVKYCGDKAVGHRLVVQVDGDWVTLHQTHDIFWPFWRRKSYKKTVYKAERRES